MAKRTEIPLEEIKEIVKYEILENAKLTSMGMDINSEDALKAILFDLNAYEKGEDWRIEL